MFSHLNRRRFLRVAAGCSAAIVANRAGLCRPADTDASVLVSGKDSRLIVHNSKTLEIETPLGLLREYPITPKKVLFVRNNQELADTRTTKAPQIDQWQIDVVGMVENPRRVDLQQLHGLEQTEVAMVLQCSGNGRANFSKAAAAKGSQWQEGAVANVRFRGVKLKTLFETLDLNIAPDAHFLTAEGKEGSPKPTDADFEHSIPLDDALARSIVALELNGEPIPAVHGGPVRLVTPGYFGTMHIKWLSRLRLETRETYNHHQRRRYRTPHEPIEPGSDFTYDFDNSDANWRMRIKSTIFTPLDGESMETGDVEVRGVAWNDRPGSPYAWYPWSTTVTLEPGKQRLMARAIDALGRTQPLDGAIGWNPAGYGWNGVHRVEVNVSEQ
jgi:DMSO/TMAO reductase YedYZ molybdopterin-dependent catalytic subunit